jgi:hypothetical protein
MLKRELVLLLLFCFTFSLTAAQLSLSETENVYNLGDKLYVSINGIVGAEEGNLNLNLVCSNTTVSLLKVSARAFPQESESSYSLPYKILSEEDLEIININDLVGNCNLETTSKGQIASSSQFKVSNEITIEVSPDKESYNPGEKIILGVSIEKENGEDYSGELQLSNFTEDLVLIEAQKDIEIDLEDTLEAGTYTIMLRIEDDLGNNGEASFEFEINQVPSRISFGVNTLEVIPGGNLTISGDVLDQGGEIIYDTINFEIISPKGFKISETLQPEEESIELLFPFNSTKGDWRIIASAGDLRDELTFNILPSAHLEYSLEEDILTVTNNGNTNFKDYFNLTIGPTEKRVFVDLDPTESKQFILTAPHGDYEIGLNDGKTTFSGSTFLTGNAVSIKDLNTGKFFASPILWLLLIAILGIGGYILIQKNPKTRKFKEKFVGLKNIGKKLKKKAPKKYSKNVSESLNFTTKSPEVQSIDEKNYNSEDKTMRDFTLNKLKTAESALVLKGDKVSGSVLALKVTNYEQLNEHSKEGLEKIIHSVKDQHAVIDKRNNYIFFLFVPQVTKTYKNEILATKAGIKILESLEAFNKKFKQKILFNLGINSGDLVVSKEHGKIKYTSLGNTVAFSKRLSDTGNGKLVVNDEIRKKLLRDLKVEKHVTINEKQTFSVISIKDKEANEAKLKDLLKRM